jgi:hypothetical protein
MELDAWVPKGIKASPLLVLYEAVAWFHKELNFPQTAWFHIELGFVVPKGIIMLSALYRTLKVVFSKALLVPFKLVLMKPCKSHSVLKGTRKNRIRTKIFLSVRWI